MAFMIAFGKGNLNSMTDSPRISIVDDDASVRRAIGRLCRSAGYEVDAYESAEAFLDKCGASPSCLILDVHLPGSSGLQLQADLNADTKRFPIIFVTAFEDDQMREKAIQAGAVEFLIKPVDSEIILGAIQSAIE
jgi:FixJ family two-component response regulator